MARVLVHIHTWNDADVVGTAVEAALRQTVTVEEILVVDNASTDGTADMVFPPIVTVIRNPVNLGPSGAVTTGLDYALRHHFDWLWVLDADSVPRPDALELLLQLVESDGAPLGIIGSSHNLVGLGQMLRGRILTPGGPRRPRERDDNVAVECDSVIWSGTLFNLRAVLKVGMPRAGKLGPWEDFCLDYGDVEYTYRIHCAGFRVVVHRDSIMDHSIGSALQARFLGFNVRSTNHSAFRRYVYFRNLVFFWLQLYPRRNWLMLMAWFIYRLSSILAGIALLERSRGPKIRACFVGIRDGLRGQLDRGFTSP